VTEVDDRFTAARHGDLAAFTAWMGRVERPIRVSLAPFASAVDVEGIVQETLLRMWILVTDAARARELAGENASLRFAIGMARNLARNEARRTRRELHLPTDELPDMPIQPEPASDPSLRRAIADCLKRIATRPREALLARLAMQHAEGDRGIARSLGMSVNSFFQNIVRARLQLTRCLEKQGVPPEEIRA
jgi:DNA-directed RNA polymerase specialized sigma24 family protein